jgi:hypothetical protein
MIALTTSPVLIFSLLSIKKISLIFSTIHISSIIPATIPNGTSFYSQTLQQVNFESEPGLVR